MEYRQKYICQKQGGRGSYSFWKKKKKAPPSQGRGEGEKDRGVARPQGSASPGAWILQGRGGGTEGDAIDRGQKKEPSL